MVTDGTTCRRCRATADTDRHNAQEDIGRLSKDWARSAPRPARGAAGGPLESPQATGALLLSPPGTASSHRLLAGDSLPATPPFRLAPPTPMVPGPPQEVATPPPSLWAQTSRNTFTSPQAAAVRPWPLSLPAPPFDL